jgi:hypothetical protein
MKPATVLAAVLLALVALGHVLRLLFRTEVVVSGTVVPMWVSVPGILVALALAIGLWRERR